MRTGLAMARWGVWLTALGQTLGQAQTGPHPVLVASFGLKRSTVARGVNRGQEAEEVV